MASRVFRASGTWEVVWVVQPGIEQPPVDWQAVVFEALQDAGLGYGTSVTTGKVTEDEQEELRGEPA